MHLEYSNEISLTSIVLLLDFVTLYTLFKIKILLSVIQQDILSFTNDLFLL